MKKTVLLVVLLGFVAFLWSQPVVDGVVKAGEYPNVIKVLDDTATIYYAVDTQGGINFAVVAKTQGWVGLGLGSAVMDGAFIFMGYFDHGKGVFSEQKGDGHTHNPVTAKRADASIVVQNADTTTIEFHIPAGMLPFTGKKFNYIVAYSGAADLATYHEENETGGVITLK